jgi:RNA polymerase sigma-70 factor (ECF subfamily)
LALRIVCDRSEAEDIVHDAFVTMHARAAWYSPERGSPIAWLVTLVRNLSIDRTRRRSRRGLVLRRVAAEDTTRPTTDPETQLSLAIAQAGVRCALAGLSEVHRSTLELAFFEGLSYSDIATRQHLPLGTIKSRAARALASLRLALEAEGIRFDEAHGSPQPPRLFAGVEREGTCATAIGDA